MAPRGDRKSSKCGVASVLPFLPVFSELALNYADLKPLDFIEAPPVADKARDLSEQIQSDATRFKRAARQYLRGEIRERLFAKLPLQSIFISSAGTFLSAEFQPVKSPNCVFYFGSQLSESTSAAIRAHSWSLNIMLNMSCHVNDQKNTVYPIS